MSGLAEQEAVNGKGKAAHDPQKTVSVKQEVGHWKYFKQQNRRKMVDKHGSAGDHFQIFLG